MASDYDCGFEVGEKWFRYRAGAIILHDGKVLMAHNDTDPYYYSIGGGVHHGETAEDAVKREVFEETGCHMDVDRLAFIHENFFQLPGASGKAPLNCHEICFYFLMKYDDSLRPIATGSVTSDDKSEWWEWVEVERYSSDVATYPTFFATELAAIDDDVVPRQIVTHG